MSLLIPLKQELAEQIPWLIEELGFRVVEDSYDPKSFGDSLVTLESAGLRVRFIRDRGQVFAEVAALSDPAKWWNLEHVCELVYGQSVEPGFELASVAALFRSSLPALADYLGPKHPETRRELDRRAEERKNEFLRRYSP